MNIKDHEATQAAISYGTAGVAVLIAHLADMANIAHDIAMILAALIAAVRLIYDVRRLYKDWKK